jgi:hypothetical protein
MPISLLAIRPDAAYPKGFGILSSVPQTDYPRIVTLVVLGEEILIQAFELQRPAHTHPDAVFDHQVRRLAGARRSTSPFVRGGARIPRPGR